jgi:hypothetical protein
MELKVRPRIVFSGAVQSCSWNEKLPIVTPKMMKPIRAIIRSFEVKGPDVLLWLIPAIRLFGDLRRPSNTEAREVSTWGVTGPGLGIGGGSVIIIFLRLLFK